MNFKNNKSKIDLKALEKRLDEILAKETKETLTNWLLKERKKQQK